MSVKRHIGQQVALATAAFCALLALPAFGLFLWLWRERGLNDTWTPSALASVAFLGACAIVLYVMSRPRAAAAGRAGCGRPLKKGKNHA